MKHWEFWGDVGMDACEPTRVFVLRYVGRFKYRCVWPPVMGECENERELYARLGAARRAWLRLHHD